MKNAAAIIVGSVVFSTGAAFALLNVIDTEPYDSAAPAIGAMQMELTTLRRTNEALSQRIAGLETQVEAAALTASRAIMPEISDAQLERIVARVMDARGAAPTEAGAQAPEAELDLQAIFTSLLGTNPDTHP